jgi:hypothetical protein
MAKPPQVRPSPDTYRQISRCQARMLELHPYMKRAHLRRRAARYSGDSIMRVIAVLFALVASISASEARPSGTKGLLEEQPTKTRGLRTSQVEISCGILTNGDGVVIASNSSNRGYTCSVTCNFVNRNGSTNNFSCNPYIRAGTRREFVCRTSGPYTRISGGSRRCR